MQLRPQVVTYVRANKHYVIYVSLLPQVVACRINPDPVRSSQTINAQLQDREEGSPLGTQIRSVMRQTLSSGETKVLLHRSCQASDVSGGPR